ncbi:hypothetical protein ACFYZB_20120 [Streptomyces sp. NPDC001852]|uniref:hypothetical protein n=1 Tax=Streptomyces sp. NPDC001852 TaxID=3364619 RepID=UPI0036805887
MADELRNLTELLLSPTTVSEEEIDGALARVDGMTADALEGEEFTDRYTATPRPSRRSSRPSARRGRCLRRPSRSSRPRAST